MSIWMVTNRGHFNGICNMIFCYTVCGVKSQIPLFDMYLYNTY